MYKLRVIPVVVVLGLALGILLSGVANAADPKSPVQTFGTVDMEKVFESYDKKKELDQKLDSFGRGALDKLRLRQGHKLLTAEEFGQLVDLKAKPNPTADDKAKIETLQATSLELDKELQTLQQKPQATDAEKARLTELQTRAKASDDILNDEYAKSQADYKKMQVDLSKQLVTDIDAAIATVAKSKGYTIVFNKSAGGAAAVVAYSSADISDDVIKKLNKK